MTNKDIVTLLNDMYKIAIKKVFLEDTKASKPQLKNKKSDHEKNSISKKENYS